MYICYPAQLVLKVGHRLLEAHALCAAELALPVRLRVPVLWAQRESEKGKFGAGVSGSGLYIYMCVELKKNEINIAP